MCVEKGRELAGKSGWLTHWGALLGAVGDVDGKVGLSLFMEAVNARPRRVASALWTVGPT